MIELVQRSLNDLLVQTDSGTWGDPADETEGYPVLRSTNIVDWELNLKTDIAYRSVSMKDVERKKLLTGDIIVTKSSGSPRLIGEAALFDVEHGHYLFSNFMLRLRVDSEVILPLYLFYYLKSPNARRVISDMHRTTSGLRNLQQKPYLAQNVPIPYPDDPPRSLDVQRRIVARIEALLTEVREMRELQADIASNTDKLLASAIQQVFEQNQDSWITEDLSNAAYVQTGTAKGRRYGDRATIELPYLRVANVQAGYLDLSEIKTILIAEDEIDRYRLQVGDLLLTEGGDYDKLGRGSVWMGEIDPCIHQNHVFAVRFDQSKVLPRFAEYEMQSEYAKQYFLKVAKKTTNLASINKTQLSAFPLKYPSNLRAQQYIIEYLDRIKSEVSDMQNIETTDTDLIGQLEQAILAQAFRGEL